MPLRKPRMLRLFLERFLIGQTGTSTVGVPLRIGGQQRILFARVTNLLSDGDGLRQCWDWKGASSLKTCFKHYNVFKKDSDLAHRQPGYVEATCTDVSKCVEWAPGDLYDAADAVDAASEQVAAGEMTKTLSEDLRKSVGLNANPIGLLRSPVLRC